MSGAALTLAREVQVRNRIKSMCVSRLPPSSRTLPPARASSRPPAHVRVFPPNPPPPPPPRARRSYNRRQADFAALKEYNDYLETVEDIIFNLCEGNDVRATEARVDAYRRENAAEIARLNRRNAEEEARLRAAAPVAMDHSARDPTSDAWAPRRMSEASDLEDTPAATRTGGGAGGGDPPAPGSSAGPPSRDFGYRPGGYHAQAQILPVPTAVPAPLSAGKMQGGGHGRHAHHAGWNDAEDTAEGRARRDAAVARACGVDVRALARRRAWQEASQSLSCA